ncbi:YezD family protein [Paenisporosarcina sp. TG20]|uniref:YezD family protein n=1 Tax=Paenisporosarcina sp. TG20 TaxID=1211706 RepID=UPI0002ED2CA5|nr:YezD family protein [Paenisporosarcina sp. TG20]
MGKIEASQIEHIVSTIEKLQYGSVVINVHNGEIMQIDATEKRRFTPSKRPASPSENK